jgi:hypothetical protein
MRENRIDRTTEPPQITVPLLSIEFTNRPSRPDAPWLMRAGGCWP